MDLSLLIILVFFIIVSLLALSRLYDNVGERRRIFENIASKRKGKVALEKYLKLIIPYKDREVILSFEKRWITSRIGHPETTLNRVSVVSFQFDGEINYQFQIVIKDVAAKMAFGMLDGMLKGMSDRTGIQLQSNSSLEDFIFLSPNPVFARDFLSSRIQQCLLQLKDSQPVVKFEKGHFELLVHRKLRTEEEWEDLLNRGQLLIDRLFELNIF